jgi:hypothetical protein
MRNPREWFADTGVPEGKDVDDLPGCRSENVNDDINRYFRGAGFG